MGRAQPFSNHAARALEDNRAFHRKLASLGVAHVYNEFPGTHGWKHWRAHLRESLVAVTAGMDRWQPEPQIVTSQTQSTSRPSGRRTT